MSVRLPGVRPLLRAARSRGVSAAGRAAAGNNSTALSPGALSSNRSVPLCSRATAAASESPRPEPGREREFSSRTKRSCTRSRSIGAIPGPWSPTLISIICALALRRNADAAFCAMRPGAPYFSALSTRLASAWPIKLAAAIKHQSRLGRDGQGASRDLPPPARKARRHRARRPRHRNRPGSRALPPPRRGRSSAAR